MLSKQDPKCNPLSLSLSLSLYLYDFSYEENDLLKSYAETKAVKKVIVVGER